MTLSIHAREPTHACLWGSRGACSTHSESSLGRPTSAKAEAPPSRGGARTVGSKAADATAAHLCGELFDDGGQIVASLRKGLVQTIRLQAGLLQKRRDQRQSRPAQAAANEPTSDPRVKPRPRSVALTGSLSVAYPCLRLTRR